MVNLEGRGSEILYNVDHISKIEVTYGFPDENGKWVFMTDLKIAMEDPRAVRVYNVHVAGDQFQVCASPGDPVVAIFEEIYKKASRAE